MSKKLYILITPANPEHSLTEAGLRVTRTQMTDEDLKVWLKEWGSKGVDFYLEQDKTTPIKEGTFKVKLVSDENLPVTEFTLEHAALQQWLSNYGAMHPDHRSAGLEITQVAA